MNPTAEAVPQEYPLDRRAQVPVERQAQASLSGEIVLTPLVAVRMFL
jgi:hypothetical protein